MRNVRSAVSYNAQATLEKRQMAKMPISKNASEKKKKKPSGETKIGIFFAVIAYIVRN